MLAQSSDWPFIMTTKTMVEYALKGYHSLLNFRNLNKQIRRTDQLSWLKYRGNDPFPILTTVLPGFETLPRDITSAPVKPPGTVGLSPTFARIYKCPDRDGV